MANYKKPITCGKVWNMFLQVTLWLSIIWIPIAIFVARADILAYVLPASIIYFFYWITQLCSNSCSYLTHKKDGNSIHSYMGGLFYTPAHIDFHIECYHYETRTTYHTDKDGRTTTSSYTEKVVTYVGRQTFKYHSWLDVSGPFLLNTIDFVHDPKFAWVKLNITFQIEFYDSQTQADFDYQKNTFIDTNKNRDTHYSFTQKERLDGYTQYNLVSLSDTPSPTIKARYLVLSTLFCVAEFYKKYVDGFCIRQNFIIKKVVSTRINLQSDEITKQFLLRMPKIVIQQTEVSYNDPSKLGAVPTLQSLDLPGIDEVNRRNSISSNNGKKEGHDYPITAHAHSGIPSLNDLYKEHNLGLETTLKVNNASSPNEVNNNKEAPAIFFSSSNQQIHNEHNQNIHIKINIDNKLQNHENVVDSHQNEIRNNSNADFYNENNFSNKAPLIPK